MVELNGINVAGTTLIASVLVAGSASTMLSGESDDFGQDAQKILNDVMVEITTYLQIQDVFGKYYNSGEDRAIERIVIVAKQYIHTPVNLSDLAIQLCNNEDVVFLEYSGQSHDVGSNALFSHPAWESLESGEFGVLVANDNDRSVLDYGIINGDLIHIIVSLPDQFKMKGKDSVTVSIVPNNGITTSIDLESPSFHEKNVISFRQI